MSFETDLNQRERQRYAKQLRATAKAAEECASALEAEDDSNAMVQFILYTLSGQSVAKDLGDAMLQAGEAAKARGELETEVPPAS